MSDLELFKPNAAIPAYLQEFRSPMTKNMLVSTGRNRIGLSGSRFRLILNGVETRVIEENYIDVIFVGIAPDIAQIYYEGEYVPGAKILPTCYSSNGRMPNEDVRNKQATACSLCPHNVKGSSVGAEGKVSRCGKFKRAAVVLADDFNHIFQLDIKSKGLWGDSMPDQNKYSFDKYSRLINSAGYDLAWFITRISFDTSSSVPKLLFSPRANVSQERITDVFKIIESPEVSQYIEVSSQTLDFSSETHSETPIHTPTLGGLSVMIGNSAAASAPVVQPITASISRKKAAPVETKAAPIVQVTDVPSAAPSQEDVELENLLANLG